MPMGCLLQMFAKLSCRPCGIECTPYNLQLTLKFTYLIQSLTGTHAWEKCLQTRMVAVDMVDLVWEAWSSQRE